MRHYRRTILFRLWDAGTGQLIRILTGHTNQVSSTAFSLDGLTLAIGSPHDTVRLWSAVHRAAPANPHWA